MSDLYVNSRLTLLDDELAITAARSSGPGGQNVNKVNSKVTLALVTSALQGSRSGLAPAVRGTIREPDQPAGGIGSAQRKVSRSSP